MRNEFESGENNPQLVLYGKMLASAYQWHNYAHMPIGARSDIENVNIERLQAFYKLYYQPDNAVLIVAGKFETDPTLAADRQVLRHDSEAFAQAADASIRWTRCRMASATVTLRRVGNSKFVGHDVPHGARRAPDYVATDVLGDVLTLAPVRAAVQIAGGDQEGRVPSRAWSEAQHDPGTITFFAQIPDGDEIAPARDAMLTTIEDIEEGADHGSRSRADPRAKAAKYYDDVMSNPQKFGVAISECHRARRLAPVLPAARPVSHGHAGRRAARGARVPQALQRDHRRIHSRCGAGSRASACRRSTSRRWSRTTRATPLRRLGETFDHEHRQPRRAHAALHSPERDEGRAAAQEDAAARRSASR